MIRCYITDRRTCPIDLLDNIEHQARTANVDHIQLREKDLTARELLDLTVAALRRIDGTPTRLLVNTRADVALAAGAHGVHLPSHSPSPAEFRRLNPAWTISVSCHEPSDLIEAASAGADFALYSPIFETPNKGPAIGLPALAAAVRSARIPVLALGGITWQNAEDCVRIGGAAGIAAIRLFQTNTRPPTSGR